MREMPMRNMRSTKNAKTAAKKAAFKPCATCKTPAKCKAAGKCLAKAKK